jgi:tetratricopeptide (TPR) repeat protein
MPTVINGIGTWYYGKRRIHRRKSVCGFCKHVAELESYDTTLYFVVFFVPLLPLGSKRIIESCPSCRRHRVVSLKKWEQSKAQHIAQLLEKLKENPDDRDTILAGLSLAWSYQDPILFDKLADTLARPRLEDPVIQTQLGKVSAYFSRYAEAETAYRAALAVHDDPDVRCELGMTLLKQGRPREALPYLRHILDERLSEDAGCIYLLIQGYQAEGLHQEALDLLDQRDTAFPQMVKDKTYQKQRQVSERYRDSGKKVPSAYLSESPRTGYREGSWTASVPRIIGPLVVLGLLLWYLGAAVWFGANRQVHLLNGADQPYTVVVNGQEQVLRPGVPVPMRVTEGEVTVEVRDARLALEPIHCRVETSFFTRPFASRTFVINPDQLAVVVHETAEFAENPAPFDKPPEVHLGQPLYTFTGIDYEFAPFPATIQVEQGHTVTKQRVGVLSNLTSLARLRLAEQTLSPEQRLDHNRRLLTVKPNDVVVLTWLLAKLSEADGLALLRSRLGDRPVLVEWHRAYQGLMEKAHPEEDLRPFYQQLVADTGRHPDALYLLARLPQQDADEPEKLYREAAAAQPPSAYALHALGYDALEQGHFEDAVRWTSEAVALAPDNPTIKQGQRQALLAARKYDQLLEQIRVEQQQPGQKAQALVQQLQIYALKGDKVQAQATLVEALRSLADPKTPSFYQEMEAELGAYLCYAQNDAARYLELAPHLSEQSRFEVALLRGNLREAAGLVNEQEEALTQHALLYLAASKAGEAKLAEEQWPLLLAALDKERGPQHQLDDMLAGRRPLDVDQVLRLRIEPLRKRVLLAVAAQRDPKKAKELLTLARQLDYAPDATSLCLRKLLE